MSPSSSSSFTHLLHARNPVTDVESADFTKHSCLKKVLRIYLLWGFCFFWCFVLFFLHKKGRRCKQREEQRVSHFTIRGGRARFLHFQVLFHWILEVGAFSYRQKATLHETFIHSARACWLLSNVPTENGGVRIFSGPLCRAIFL